jgi:adenylate cyclase
LAAFKARPRAVDRREASSVLGFAQFKRHGATSRQCGIVLSVIGRLINMLPRNWRPKQRRRVVHGIVLLGVGGFLSLLFALVQPFQTINRWASDQLLESDTPSPNIVIVGIDDKSLETHGRWSTWPRSVHAQAIDNLGKAGASTIGFDIVFADSSPDDDEVAAAIKKAGNVVLAGAGVGPLPSEGTGIAYGDFLTPSVVFLEASRGLGHVNVVSDPDGRVRRLPLVIHLADGRTYPALSVAMLLSLFNMSPPSGYVLHDGHLDLLARSIPVDPSSNLRINFAVDGKNLPYISYADAITGQFDASLVRNRMVLVGMTATGEIDAWQTTVSQGKLPGVFVHAAAMDTILRQRYLVEADIRTTVSTMLLLCGICVFALPRFGTWYWTDLLKGTGLVVGLLLAYAVTSSVAASNGHILNVLYPSLTLVGLYVSNLLYVVVREQSDKRFVKTLFGRYVSSQVSRTLVSLASEGRLALGGEEREVTILFADIRNFTQISERMTPDEVVKMINFYLPFIIDAVANNGGMVNKFAGDSIMAVWNAPQYQPDHAWLAVKAALDAQTRMAGIGYGEPGSLSVRFGIGINTGKALAGNVGTAGRSEYTVIGDAVNLASRICGSTPGGEVWIGPDTYQQVTVRVQADTLEPQVFKGKSQPVPVYRVTGLRT